MDARTTANADHIHRREAQKKERPGQRNWPDQQKQKKPGKLLWPEQQNWEEKISIFSNVYGKILRFWAREEWKAALQEYEEEQQQKRETSTHKRKQEREFRLYIEEENGLRGD